MTDHVDQLIRRFSSPEPGDVVVSRPAELERVQVHPLGQHRDPVGANALSFTGFVLRTKTTWSSGIIVAVGGQTVECRADTG